MNLEEKNKIKRKNEPLTNSEWLTFFFFPFNNINSLNLMNTNKFNKKEEFRFEKFGFDKKLKQSETARIFGYLFYGILAIIIILIN